MALNFDTTQTAYAQLPEAERDALWGAAQSIIFQTISNGMGEITEKNAPEFYARQLVWCRINGFDPSTPEQIQMMVGLKTNVSLETEAKWRKRTMDRPLDDAARKYRAAITELAAV